jgi:hypothetical protein
VSHMEGGHVLPILEEEPLPELYQRWLRQLLPGPIPRETRATCESCAMLAPSPAVNGQSVVPVFSGLTKCCTYLPELPNYLVGGAISAVGSTREQMGARSVEERIGRLTGVTPLGLGRTAVFGTIYEAAGSPAFGRSPTLRCPHYLEVGGGACGIWSFRNSVCATWFCKHSRGAIGGGFWQETQRLLGRVERELSIWCCSEMGLDPQTMRVALTRARLQKHEGLVEEIVSQDPQEVYRQTWGEWYGREVAFFRECAPLASKLEWPRVVDLCGQEVAARASSVVVAYSALVTGSSARSLRATASSCQDLGDGKVCCTTYRSYDPLTIPTSVWQCLRAFDGRPVDQVLAGLPTVVKDELSQGDLLQQLIDYRLLEEVVP